MKPTGLAIRHGRTLFLNEAIQSLNSLHKTNLYPYSACMVIVDENDNIIPGILNLCFRAGEKWYDVEHQALSETEHLFPYIPIGPKMEYQPYFDECTWWNFLYGDYPELYRPYGYSGILWDCNLPRHMYLKRGDLYRYHYHRVAHPHHRGWHGWMGGYFNRSDYEDFLDIDLDHAVFEMDYQSPDYTGTCLVYYSELMGMTPINWHIVCSFPIYASTSHVLHKDTFFYGINIPKETPYSVKFEWHPPAPTNIASWARILYNRTKTLTSG